MTLPKNISIKIATPKGLRKPDDAIIYSKAIELQQQLGIPVFIQKEFDDGMSSEIVNPIERAILPTKQYEYRNANNQ